MKESEQIAARKGGGLARWLSTVIDTIFLTCQSRIERTFLTITSRFQSKYYEKLVYICRNYETQGLDKDQILKLKNVFVPLEISPKSLANVSPRMVNLMKEEDKDYQRSTIEKFLSLMARDEQYRRFAILGAPGSGKSTLLRYLTLSYATRSHRRLLKGAPNFIPILIYLRDVFEDISDVSLEESPSLEVLITRWVERLQTSQPLKPPPGWFRNKLRENKCLVMLDGLDEVADEGKRQQVSRWVDKQMDSYPKTPFVITSRPFGYMNAQLSQPVMVLEVQPFTFQQVNDFIHNWYLQAEIASQGGIEDTGIRDEAIQQADDLFERVRNEEALIELARNPLLLTMIATVHRRGNALPGSRVELYKEICQVLLDKRQRAKTNYSPLRSIRRSYYSGHVRSNEQRGILASQKKAILQTLSLWLMENEKREFSLEEVSDLLESELSKISRPNTSVESFLRDITDVSGLLVMQKREDLYEFAHLSLQEYLASVKIRDSNREQLLLNMMSDENKISWWGETIRLYAAQGDTTKIVQAALQGRTIAQLSLAQDCVEEGLTVNPLVSKELDEFMKSSLELA